MAKNGFFSKIIMGDDNNSDFTDKKLPTNRWSLFFDVVKNNFGKIFKINLLSLLFVVPFIVVVVIFYLQRTYNGVMINGTGNFGIGYPAVNDAFEQFETMTLALNLYEYLFLIPCVIIFAIGLAGCCYTMRRLVWGESVMIGSAFKAGIKANIREFIPASIIVSMSFFGMIFSYSGLDLISVPTVLKVILRVFGIIQFSFVIMMFMYFCTQSVTYNLPFFGLVKNSFLFTLALLPQNVFFFALSAIPAALVIFFTTSVWLVGPAWIIFIILGVSYMVLVWTVYNHYVYDKFVNDKVKGAKKNRNMYVPTEEEKKQSEIEYIKNRNTIYGSAYASKRLSSIDEGQTITPLTETFNRNDLKRLDEEKTILHNEVENEKSKIEIELMNEELELIKKKEEQSKSKKKKK